MNKVTAVILVVVLLLVGWYIYHEHGTSPTAPAASQSSSSETSNVISSVGTGQTKMFTVSGGNYYFDPKTITVNKGDTVQITFTNSGGEHDFVLDEFGVKTPVIGSGKTATVTFLADKSGTFQYYCSVGDHRAMGMVGTLIVQ